MPGPPKPQGPEQCGERAGQAFILEQPTVSLGQLLGPIDQGAHERSQLQTGRAPDQIECGVAGEPAY